MIGTIGAGAIVAAMHADARHPAGRCTMTSIRMGIDIGAGPAAFQFEATGAIGRDGDDDLRLAVGGRLRF